MEAVIALIEEIKCRSRENEKILDFAGFEILKYYLDIMLMEALSL